MKYFYLFFN